MTLCLSVFASLRFQSLAVRRSEFVATLALTPALSPRRGRILRRVLSQCQPSVLRQFSPANQKPQRRDERRVFENAFLCVHRASAVELVHAAHQALAFPIPPRMLKS